MFLIFNFEAARFNRSPAVRARRITMHTSLMVVAIARNLGLQRTSGRAFIVFVAVKPGAVPEVNVDTGKGEWDLHRTWAVASGEDSTRQRACVWSREAGLLDRSPGGKE